MATSSLWEGLPTRHERLSELGRTSSVFDREGLRASVQDLCR